MVVRCAHRWRINSTLVPTLAAVAVASLDAGSSTIFISRQASVQMRFMVAASVASAPLSSGFHCGLSVLLQSDRLPCQRLADFLCPKEAFAIKQAELKDPNTYATRIQLGNQVCS